MRGTNSDHTPHGGSPSSSSAASAAASAFSSSVSMALRGGRSVLSIRRNQVVAMETSPDGDLHELELFQTHVADRLLALSEDQPKKKEQMISVSFLRKLLEAFLCCDDEFRGVLVAVVGRGGRGGAERAVGEHVERVTKGLDICNAVSEALDGLGEASKHAEIAAEVVGGRGVVGEAQVSRARNALGKLLAVVRAEERVTERIRSVGRSGRSSASSGHPPSVRHPQRTLSLTVSKSWSAARQLQAMTANLNPPRGGDGGALVLALYTMSSVLVLVMWILVAAFPSSEKTSAPTFPSPPRHLPWAGPMSTLQERIVEEWKKKDKKAAALMPAGMLAELQGLENYGKGLVELGETASYPLEEDLAEKITTMARELGEVCQAVEEDIGPLQRQVREVFHRIVRSRAEVVELALQGNRTSSPAL